GHSSVLRPKVDVFRVRCGSERRRCARVATNAYHFILIARPKRQHTKRLSHAIEHLRAEHRAIVIDEREDDRTFAKILPQFHLLAALVAKYKIERQLVVQFLVETDVL